MNTMNKAFRSCRRTLAALLCALLLCPGIIAGAISTDEVYRRAADEAYYNDGARFVLDTANILSQDTENGIIERGRALLAAGKGQIQLVTIDSLDGEDQSDYSIELFNKEKLGDADRDDGVLILLILDGNHCQIVTGDGIADTLTDSRCGAILDMYTVTAMQVENYDKAAKETYDVAAGYLEGRTESSVESEVHKSERVENIAGNAILIIIFVPLAMIALGIVFVLLDLIFRLLLYPFRKNWNRTFLGAAGGKLCKWGFWPIMFVFRSRGGGFYGGGFSGGGFSGGGSVGGGGSSSGGGAGR